jgi:putative tryptophan/tyrosine transport system permease protein
MMPFFISALILGVSFLPLSLGVYLSLKVYSVPDITTDGSFVLGASLSAVLIEGGVSPLLVIPIILFAGFLSGVCTGLIHTKLGVNALLSGIIIMTALFSINLAILGKPNLSLMNYEGLFGDPSYMSESPTNIILLIGIVTGIYLLFGYLLKTDYGLSMRATGSNETMAKVYGINTITNKVAGLGFANGLSALSGFLLVQIQGFADVNMGVGIVISGLASVMIADKLTPVKFNFSVSTELIFLIVGTMVYRLIISCSLLSGIPSGYMKLLTAFLVLSVLFIPSKKNKFIDGK